ncbi:MAG: Ig domain-containing protein, partial [Deltaproteobacteria bacterium]|nr:Ig domain-containing protein [Deltaproteobacteria bacterium]
SQPAATTSRAIEVEVTAPATQPLMLPPTTKRSLRVGTFYSAALPAATGGVQPYTYSFTCAGGTLPSGMGFAPETLTFAGTPDTPFRDSCTYTVTDSSQPAATTSRAIEVEVTAPATPPLEFPQKIVEGKDTDAEIRYVELGVELRVELTVKIGRHSQTTFQAASGGIEPYTYEVVDCMLPAGLEFHSSTRVLSGTPDAEYRGPNCTYRVTDNSSPPVSASRSFVLIVEPLERSDWRFRTRTVAPEQGWCVLPGSGSLPVATLPRAHGGVGQERYGLPGVPDQRTPPNLLFFNPSNRVLTFANPRPPPVLGTPNTYRYLVGTETPVTASNAKDALCLDFRVDSGVDICLGDPNADPPLRASQFIHVQLQVRDDAFWDGNAGEYRCPDTTAPTPRPGAQGVSNPVHEALGPVHARRAAAVASAAVRDRVHGWSPGSEQASFALTPEVGFASLSGQHDGFDYTGNSESATVGAETGAGAWQAGLVASFTRTELRYQAEAALAELGYRTGEHDSEILSLHPFAAWHLPSGGHLWAVLGGGTGDLRHRDDLGFPSWSNSDVRLLAYAAGASVPLAEMLSGELQVEAGIDSFAFDIKGGGRISSSLPTMRGVDYRAGLAWSAPVRGSPSVSLAYRHATGDGLEGGLLEARGSVFVEGILHPRLALIGNAEGSVGLGDYEQDFWRLGGGVRFAPDSLGRGFGLELNTRLASLGDGAPSGVGIRGEVGYGLWGGPFFRTMRPYVGLVRYSDGDSVRRTLGLDLGHASNWPIKIEVLDRSDDQSLRFSLRHRF